MNASKFRKLVGTVALAAGLSAASGAFAGDDVGAINPGMAGADAGNTARIHHYHRSSLHGGSRF